MKITHTLIIVTAFFAVIGFKEKAALSSSIEVIAHGMIPDMAKDSKSNLHLVFGKGDSILYSFSNDDGRSFSTPVLVGVQPKLYSFAMRGPQIAVTGSTITVIAADQHGNIYSYLKGATGKWVKTVSVNDVDTIAKEGMLALGSDGKNFQFAVWLDIRNGGHNNIYGARSTDGGKTWSRNKMIYTSPDSHVCECCKPSVAVKGNHIYVMFRNWVNGNRDLYLIHSSDGGATFGNAQKLGKGSWPLNGCPMDGGGLSINDKGIVQTVWQRKGVIYACEEGREEKEIGTGRGCTLASTGSGNVYAWVEAGNVVCLLPDGKKQVLGEGSLPVLSILNDKEVVCIWQQKEAIHKAIVAL